MSLEAAPTLEEALDCKDPKIKPLMMELYVLDQEGYEKPDYAISHYISRWHDDAYAKRHRKRWGNINVYTFLYGLPSSCARRGPVYWTTSGKRPNGKPNIVFRKGSTRFYFKSPIEGATVRGIYEMAMIKHGNTFGYGAPKSHSDAIRWTLRDYDGRGEDLMADLTMELMIQDG